MMMARLIVVCFTVLALAGCGPGVAPSQVLTSSGVTPPPSISVVASFYPLAYFTQRIGGERVQVKNLVPPGAEPHEYEPTPQDIIALTKAKVVVYNGAGLEPWVKLLPQLPTTIVKVEATKGLPVVTVEGGLDPHVWLDPLLAQQEADNILTGFISADPDGKEMYQANTRKLNDDLVALDRRYAEAVGKCLKKTFISGHEAFGYLAKRYGLTMVAISGLSPESEPSPAKLKEIAGLAKKYGVRVIYVETLVSPKLSETIAREVGATLRVLNPLEGLTDAENSAGKTYFTVMDENLGNLREGLDCS
jgi:zinc transport system substrate-binding protein